MKENRFNRIDEFLKFIATVLQQNPNFQCDRGFVYSNLIRLGVKEEDIDLSPLFSKFKEMYSSFTNMNAISNNHFCQFNSNSFNLNDPDAIKMDVPLDSEHLQTGTKMIIDYLEANKIVHCSKVASKVRFDNLVIRLKNVEDADKLQRFIDNNSYIQAGLLKPSPFTVSRGNIAYAIDGYATYNSEIARYIADYMNYLRRNDELSMCNVKDFKRFIDYKVENILSSPENLQEFKDDRLSYPSGARAIPSCLEVSLLIKENMDSNTKFTHIFEHYNCITNPDFKKKLNETLEEKEQDYKKNIATTINKVIATNLEKYDIEHVLAAFIQYVNTGNPIGFTRNNNSRDEIYKLSNKNIFDNFNCNKENMEESIRNHINNVSKLMNNEKENETVFAKNSLEFACIATIKKYGAYQLKGALTNLIKSGNYQGFTNDFGARTSLMKMSVEHIIREIYQNSFNLNEQNQNYNLDNYIDAFVSNIEAKVESNDKGQDGEGQMNF